jgi:FkbM family methyltransferase
MASVIVRGVRNLSRGGTSPAGTIGPGGVPSALSGDAFERVTTDVGDLWISTQDHVMRHYLRTRAAWEEHEADLLRQLITPGCRFLDVGANIGYFSLLAARCGAGSVDAVEPHPGLLQLLRFNLWMNRAPASVWPVALDTERRGLPLSSSRNNLGDTRVEHVQKEASYDLVVPALPGDELFHGRSFDVMKIDVQGWELDVLTGMQGVIRDSPSVRIVAEFWPTAIRQRGLDPLRVLEDYRSLGLDVAVQRNEQLDRLDLEGIVRLCDGAGVQGYVNLLLSHRGNPAAEADLNGHARQL